MSSSCSDQSFNVHVLIIKLLQISNALSLLVYPRRSLFLIHTIIQDYNSYKSGNHCALPSPYLLGLGKVPFLGTSIIFRFYSVNVLACCIIIIYSYLNFYYWILSFLKVDQVFILYSSLHF